MADAAVTGTCKACARAVTTARSVINDLIPSVADARRVVFSGIYRKESST